MIVTRLTTSPSCLPSTTLKMASNWVELRNAEWPKFFWRADKRNFFLDSFISVPRLLTFKDELTFLDPIMRCSFMSCQNVQDIWKRSSIIMKWKFKPTIVNRIYRKLLAIVNRQHSYLWAPLKRSSYTILAMNTWYVLNLFLTRTHSASFYNHLICLLLHCDQLGPRRKWKH